MDRERPSPPTSPWTPDQGPEPAWAEAIRRARKARGERLRAIFDGADDGPEPAADALPEGDDR
jgi:hypothetical protein